MGAMIEGVLLAGLGLLGIREGLRLGRMPLEGSDVVGPGWYVFFISVILLVGAVAFLAVNVRRHEIVQPQAASLRFGPAGKAMAVLGVYTVATPLAGYAIGSALFFVLAFRVFGMRTWARSAAAGLVTTAIFDLFFSYIAGISMQ